jgi:hypothetical protein
MTLEKPVRGSDNSPLLGQGYACGAAAVAIVPSVSDLGENQCVSIPHDQVYFAAAGLEVTLQRFHAASV